MSIHGNARYRVTRKLELARCRLRRWNWLEIDDIFRWLEGLEVDIVTLQLREDQEGGLWEVDLREFCHKLSTHHFLLRQ